MKITFIPMQEENLPLWKKWIKNPYVCDVWFVEGYETEDVIQEKLRGNGYDYPFIIDMDDKPIGYIQCSDLYAYRLKCENPKRVFTNEDEGTWCMDLFIGEEDCLNRGYGTKVVRAFVEKIFSEYSAEKILIDPASSNKRAIRCYEKAGFKFEKPAHDGVTECCVMKIIKGQEPRIKHDKTK